MNYQTEAEKIYQSVCGGTESADKAFAKLHRDSCIMVISNALELAYMNGRIDLLREENAEMSKSLEIKS